MKLIVESIQDGIETDIINEDVNGEKKKNYYIKGIFMQSETPNRNGRFYPQHVMDKEINRYIAEYVNTNRAVGELNHPDSPSINLDKVSHRIVTLEQRGKDIFGKALILDTPMGKITKNLLDGGVQLGVSSRGLGTLVDDRVHGYQVVQEDFTLGAVDIVADPSAPNAFVNGIMEGVEYAFDRSGKIIQLKKEIDAAVKECGHITGEKEKRFLSLFENYLKSMS